MRAFLASVFAREGIELVAQAASLEAGLAAVKQHLPDLLIAGLDCESDEVLGLELIRQAIGHAPELSVVVAARSSDQRVISNVLGTGARAYVVSSSDPEPILLAIRQLSQRSLYLSYTLEREPPPQPAQATVDAIRLTRREREVLALVADGASNAQVAQRLWLAEQTIKFHLDKIYKKLGVHNRTQASLWALQTGLVTTRRARARNTADPGKSGRPQPIDPVASGWPR
jgi:DNA-binding NarL/FixJ family response regulator